MPWRFPRVRSPKRERAKGDLVAWLLVGEYDGDETDAAAVEPAFTGTENRRPEGQVDS